MTSIQPPLIPTVLNTPGITDITASVHINRVSDYQYQEAGFGGSADIFCGTYRPKGGSVVQVAVKCIRANDFEGRDREHEQRLRQKLVRELEIWHTVSGGANIIKLLGTITGVGPLVSPVCELCAGNLQDYLARKTPPPRHMKMMTDTLRGLSYMHELKPDPVAHGDIKSHNILVTPDERALICDFGRSRMPYDLPRDETRSSPFGATLRYMSPELFSSNVATPTPASDMWAYGCVALEILCRIQPYHEISNDFEVVELIKQGRTPSSRPRGARGSLVNDSLWETLTTCWSQQDWRPTSRAFLEQLMQMLQEGETSVSPSPLDLFPLGVEGPPEPWPEDMLDLSGELVIERSVGALASSQRSNVWIAKVVSSLPWKTGPNVVIKVPRLNVSTQIREPHDHLQNILRRTLASRFGIKHKNIISILGINASFSPHAGLVLEYCALGNLVTYRNDHTMDHDATSRPKPPEANAYSLICDILEALQFLHNFPVPIPQGDLTPENVMVTADGVAKVGLFSFGRIISAIPAAATLTASAGPLLPFRWMSPELLLNNKPNTESDMWAMGCVGFWILTGLRPYAGHLRDDFAGVDSVRGLPPGVLSRIDYADTLGERMIVPRRSSWITNGIWSTISRCWTVDPLLRPSATRFLEFMKELGDGKRESWVPVGVVDLAGRVKGPADERLDQIGFGRVGVTRAVTAWVQYHSGKKTFKDHIVDMNMFRTAYSPNWYSKNVQVAVKHESDRNMMIKSYDIEAYITSVRHEVVIAAQLDHPNICKFLGIDSSHDRIPAMIFEFCSNVTLQGYMNKEGSFTEKMNIVQDIASALQYMHEHTNGTIVHGNLEPNTIFIANGRAKLTNFTCAFQYVAHHAQGITPLSSIISTNYGFSRYRCPEHIKDRKEDHTPLPTVAADVWSFGCVLLRMFAKDLEFFDYRVGNREMEGKILASEEPCITGEERLKVDARVLPIIEPMLERGPAARPTMRDVLRKVQELLQ